MRRILTLALSVAVAAACTALPAGANSHEPPPPPGPVAASGTYSVTAPSPMPVHSTAGGCTVGTEGVHKDSRLFQVARAGLLTDRVTDFTGDWDAAIVDRASGQILDYAAQAFGSAESVSASLAADQGVDMVACNFAGGPTATVSYAFSPAADQMVSVGDVTVAEGDSGGRSAVFTVGLSKPPTATLAVNYTTVDGTARAGVDYTAKSGALFFAPGVVSATVKVPISPDVSDEADETFGITLSNERPAGLTMGDPSGLGTIVDDDPGTGRRLAVGDVAVPEGDAGLRGAVFTVSLSQPSASTVTVSYATAAATATATDDYTSRSGTLSFAPGVTATTVKVPVVGDLTGETDETFTLTLSGASGAKLSDATGTGTIIDDM